MILFAVSYKFRYEIQSVSFKANFHLTEFPEKFISAVTSLNLTSFIR